jgi:5,5'-dehydrodivanillate O-demethylase oxygenase subunit
VISSRQSDYTDFHHVGPGTLAGDYLRRFWHPVCIAAELAPGRAVPLKILHQKFTLYRGEGGEPHGAAARCAHRGTQLSTGWVEGDCLRCFYHGWKYDQTGQCVEQPAEDAGFAAKVRIASYPVHEYLGLIFAYLGPGEPPPLPRYGELEGRGVLTVATYFRPCNYFNNAENGIDEVHVHFVHRSGEAFKDLKYDVPEVWAEETGYGLVQYGKRADGALRVTHWLMPNALSFKNGEAGKDIDRISWRVPIDDDSHRNFSAALDHSPSPNFTGRDIRVQPPYNELRPSTLEASNAILRGEMHIDDPEIVSRPDLLSIQDNVAQIGQGVVPDPNIEHLGKSDRAIILLRKLYARELEALAQGRPLTQWRKPDVLTGASGVLAGT